MIVVTGAAGFIGSNVIAALNSLGRIDIAAVDNPEMFGLTGNLADLSTNVRVEKDDLNVWLLKYSRSIECVIHMGACSDTTQSDREFMMHNNFEYSQRLWEFCSTHGKRYVYASSAATYGDGSKGYDDNADPARLEPLNLYGESKQRFDLWALAQQEKPRGWAGLKFFNVYGNRERHKGRMASVAYHSFEQIRATGKVRLFKSDRPDFPNGGQMRDFVYVKDVVAAILHFAFATESNIEGLFNVGTGEARTFADLARAVFSALSRQPNIEFFDMPADLKGKYQYFTQATVVKLRAAGFTNPFHSLESGVKDYHNPNYPPAAPPSIMS